MKSSSRWDSPAYQRIATARYERGNLHVRFENGDEAVLVAGQLIPAFATHPDWDAIETEAYEITVPTRPTPVTLSWSNLRALSDPEYRAHLVASAEEQARLIGRRIREIRLLRGMSAKDLAETAKITQQSISRIEGGKHDVTFSTLRRVLAAMGASLADLAGPEEQPTPTLAAVWRKLKTIGLEPAFVKKRVLPEALERQLSSISQETTEPDLLEPVAAAVERVFGWTRTSILSMTTPLTLDRQLVGATQYKIRGRFKADKAILYTTYAHAVAVIVDRACQTKLSTSLPTDPLALRELVLQSRGEITFRSTIQVILSLGIPVIPLSDPGAFHAAVWRVGSRPVICLKQTTFAHARWLSDLLHEYKHAVSHLSENDSVMIDRDELSPFPDEEDPFEEEAAEFMEVFLFGGRDIADPLAKECVSRAHGDVRRLKIACVEMAQQRKVPVDAFANYLAWRLSIQDINWWGTANSLQTLEPSPFSVAKDELFRHLALDGLASHDRELIVRSVAE